MSVVHLAPSIESSRLRIGLVAPPWLTVPPIGYGGTERVIALIADGLVDRGHDVTLFAAPGSDTKANLVSPLSDVPGFINADRSDETYHSLTAFLATQDFDIVHDHTVFGPLFAAVQEQGPPMVHTLHGPWTPGARRVLGLVADQVHLVAISHAQRAANPKVRYAGMVHNGVDLDLHPFRAEKEDFLVFVGRSNAEKGPEVAVDVARAAGLPLTMMVKRSEPEEWEYWNDVVRPRLDSDVTVIEQPPQLLKAELVGRARAALCPINWPEPFGLVLAEALACGTPVITRPLGAAPEIVVDGVHGFLCDTTREMVDAVARAGELSPWECRARAEQCFSADAMVRGYERVYRSVLATGTATSSIGAARAAGPAFRSEQLVNRG
jgi:glycosyltransferase involved in cell wall biosynthesis